MKAWQRFRGWRLGKALVVPALLALSLLTGCASYSQNPYLYNGAGLGAALGAGLGAGINNRNPWKGAAVGGLLGTAGGGILGEVYGQSKQSQQGYYQGQPQGYYQGQPQGYYQQQPYYGPPPG